MTIRGTLRNIDGAPIPFAQVTLHEEGKKRDTISDNNGEFAFGIEKVVAYPNTTLTFHKDGFQTLQLNTLQTETPMTYVMVADKAPITALLDKHAVTIGSVCGFLCVAVGAYLVTKHRRSIMDRQWGR